MIHLDHDLQNVLFPKPALPRKSIAKKAQVLRHRTVKTICQTILALKCLVLKISYAAKPDNLLDHT